MPSQSSNLTALRTGNHVLRAYAAFYVPALAAAGTITANTVNPDSGLAVSFTTGSETDVERGFKIDFYTSAGAYKGSSRIAYSGVISSSNLPTREKSWGTVKVESGDLFNVMRFVPLSDRLVAATSGFEPDGETYTDQGENPPPVACSGGHVAQFVDSGQTYASITGAGSGSFTVDPDSGGSVTHVWTLPTGAGTFAPGSANTDANPVMRINVGKWLIKHAVTDSSNSKTTTQFVTYQVFDATTRPHEVIISAYSGTLEDAWSFDIQVFENASLDDIPDGTLCVLFKQEFITGTQQSFGSPTSGRSHIIGVGYLRRDVTRNENGVETLTFSVISAMARLNELVGYSKVMTSEASPDAWSEMKTLTTKRAIIQIIQFYTNLIEAGYDVVFASNYTNQLYPQFFLNEATPLTQIRELAYATDAEFACDRRGRFLVYTPHDLLPPADRSSTVVILQATAADVLSYEVTREHWRPVRLTRISGLSAGATGNVAAFAKWPGTPGEGNVQTSYERLIFDATDPNTDAYERSGRWGARNDGWYVDADGVGHFAPKLTLTLQGGYDTVFDYYGEIFRFAKSLTLREIALDDFDWILESINVEYIGGTARTTIQARAATNGNEGLDDTPPPGEPVDPPDDDPPEYDTNPGELGRGTANLAIFGSNGMMWLTGNFTAAVPAWTGTDLTALANWAGTTLLDFTVDAFSPRYTNTGTAVNGWIVTDTYILRITDIFGTPALTQQQAITTGGTPAVQMQFERGLQGFGAVVSTGGFGVWLYYTSNGTSWTARQIDTDYDTFGSVWAAGIYVSPHNPAGLLVTSVLDTTGNSRSGSPPAGSIISISSFGAGTPTTLTADPILMRAGAIHIPYLVFDLSTIYYGAHTPAADDNLLYRYSEGVATDISPSSGGDDYGIDNNRTNRQIVTCDSDQYTLLACLTDTTQTKTGVFLSRNRGDTWSELVPPSVDVDYRGAYIAGSDRNLFYLFGNNGAIGLCSNGSTVVDKMGNISTSATIRGLCGG